jgi:hypothetical protein
MELSKDSAIPFNVFKDPYLLDIFGLRENYLEADLEKAILAENEEGQEEHCFPHFYQLNVRRCQKPNLLSLVTNKSKIIFK